MTVEIILALGAILAWNLRAGGFACNQYYRGKAEYEKALRHQSDKD